jgi:hypothetical protein
VWDEDTLLLRGLPSNEAAWRELDRRQRRPNWKSGAAEFRDLGSLSSGKVVPYTDPRKRSRWGSRKKMHRRAPKISRRCNRKHKHGRSQ